MHRKDPLRWGRSSEERKGWGQKNKGVTTVFQNCTCFSKQFHNKQFPQLTGVFPSLVQKGAVCQWWLSWVKQVRPGMLHVSLFWSLLRNFRSFFLRFCSFCSHWVFCFDGTLMKHEQTMKCINACTRNNSINVTNVCVYLRGCTRAALNLNGSLFLRKLL